MFIHPSKPLRKFFDSDEDYEAAMAIYKETCRDVETFHRMFFVQFSLFIVAVCLFMTWFLTGWVGVAVLIAVVFSEIAVFQILKRWGHADKT